MHDFIEQIPEIVQKQYEQFVDYRLIKCQQFVSDKIKKNNFVTPRKSDTKQTVKDSVSLKDADFNKLMAVATYRPSESDNLFAMEFRGFPESLTKHHQMYHGNKSIALEIFNLTPSSFPTIQPVATVIDFSAIINSQASISRAKTFDEFSAEIINCIERISVLFTSRYCL